MSMASARMWQAGAEGVDALGRSILSAQELQRQRERQVKVDQTSAGDQLLRMLSAGAIPESELPTAGAPRPLPAFAGRGIGMEAEPSGPPIGHAFVGRGLGMEPDTSSNPGAALLRALVDRGSGAPGPSSGVASGDPSDRPTALVRSPGEALSRIFEERSAGPSQPDTSGYTQVAPGFYFPSAETARSQETAVRAAKVAELAGQLRAAHPSMTDAQARLQAAAAVGKLSLPSYQPATMGEELDEYGKKQGINDTDDARRQERGGVITRANQANAEGLRRSRPDTQSRGERSDLARQARERIANMIGAGAPVAQVVEAMGTYPDLRGVWTVDDVQGAARQAAGRTSSAGGVRSSLDQLHGIGQTTSASSPATAGGLPPEEVAQARSFVAHLPAPQKQAKLEEAGYSAAEIRAILGGG